VIAGILCCALKGQVAILIFLRGREKVGVLVKDINLKSNLNLFLKRINIVELHSSVKTVLMLTSRQFAILIFLRGRK
jgi:hypothetical protein